LRFILEFYFKNENGIGDKDMGLVHRRVNEEIDKSLELIKELEHVMNEIQSNENLFSSNIQNMSLIDKQSILGIWVSYVGCYNELNQIREKKNLY